MGSRTLLSGEKKPLDLNDIHFLASSTKLLTTIAALQCVERGKLALHADISYILPELGAKELLTGFGDDNGEPQLRQAQNPNTLA